jgi:NADH-quinone oxidoreductase subunit N
VAQALYHGQADKTVLVFGLVFMVAGVAFKLGLVPFHMWIPDVYHGAPTAVTMFIGSAPKLAAFAMALRLLVYGLFGLADRLAADAAGHGRALHRPRQPCRHRADQHQAHAGLFGDLAHGLHGARPDVGHLVAGKIDAAGMVYVIAYVLMSLGSFGLVVYLSRNGVEAENLDDFRGLNSRNPWLAALMAILMFSMAGLPPFIGFYAKLTILQSLVGAGYVWLAVVAVMFSLIGAFYYLRVVKILYFDAPLENAPVYAAVPGVQALLSINVLAVLVIGILPQPLLTLCTYAMQMTLQ